MASIRCYANECNSSVNVTEITNHIPIGLHRGKHVPITVNLAKNPWLTCSQASGANLLLLFWQIAYYKTTPKIYNPLPIDKCSSQTSWEKFLCRVDRG